MKKRDICWIIILFIFMWMAIAGQYLNTIDEYGLAWLYGLIDLIILSFFMIIIPFIFRLKNQERLEIEKGKKICKWNSLIMFFLSTFLSILILDGNGSIGIGGVGTVIFYFINKSLFVYDENMPKTGKKVKIKKIIEENEKEIPETIENNIKINNSNTKYCKICGGKLDENNKCKKCGKKYFKFTKSLVLYIIIGGLVITNVVFILLYDDAKKTIENISDVYSSSPSWCETQLDMIKGEHNIFYIQEKMDFYDENIVFILEGYGDYYYTYDCIQELTDGDEYSYWAYNKEAAVAKGYQKGNCN